MKQNSTIRKRALDPERKAKAGSARKPAASSTAENKAQVGGLDERIRTALSAAGDKKALDPVVLDLRDVATFTDYFLITSGTNTRQVQAIADEIVEQLKNQGTRAARVEGYNTAEWVLVDYGDFVVHVFEDKARRFYDLERLWRDATRVEIPADLLDGGISLRKEL